MPDREKLIEFMTNIDCNAEFCEDCEFCNDIDGCVRRQKEIIADRLIANGVTVQQWIPVTERLPEKDGIYLTCNKKKEYEFHLFQVGKRMWEAIWKEDGVTHWMPLPQPPKGE